VRGQDVWDSGVHLWDMLGACGTEKGCGSESTINEADVSYIRLRKDDASLVDRS
jgi:hypothetical protein